MYKARLVLSDYIDTKTANDVFFKFKRPYGVGSYLAKNLSVGIYGRVLDHMVIFSGNRMFNLKYLNDMKLNDMKKNGCTEKQIRDAKYKIKKDADQKYVNLEDLYDAYQLKVIFGIYDLHFFMRKYKDVIKDNYARIEKGKGANAIYGLSKKVVNDNFVTLKKQLSDRVDKYLETKDYTDIQKRVFRKGALYQLDPDGMEHMIEYLSVNKLRFSKDDIILMLKAYQENFEVGITQKKQGGIDDN